MADEPIQSRSVETITAELEQLRGELSRTFGRIERLRQELAAAAARKAAKTD